MKDQLGILAVIVVTAIIIVMMLWNKAYADTPYNTATPNVDLSHSGGTNIYGCHYDWIRGGYHCH